MSKVGVIAAIVVAALVALGIWVTRTGSPAGAATSNEDAAAKAYDYEVHDVKMQQMGPDGTLRYQLEAKQITQQADNGQISAQALQMYYDPPGSQTGGPNRWTLRADHADLPESGDVFNLQGDVHAEGVPLNSRTKYFVATEELTYNLRTEEVFTRKPVDFAWDGNRFNTGDIRVNIKSGAFKVDSTIHGTHAPR